MAVMNDSRDGFGRGAGSPERRYGKLQKRGDRAKALQGLRLADAEQAPQNATEIVRGGCNQVPLRHVDQAA